MKKKGKLTRAERFEINILLEKRYSYRKIGEAMERSPNTVSYEVKVNSVNGVYDPLKADRKAKVRKQASKYQRRKINENEALQAYITDKLKAHWNPDEISGRMKEDKEPFFASKTAIYEWLYSARGQRYCQHLYSERYDRKPRKTKKTDRIMIPDRVSLDKRFLGAENRTRFGHFEGDTVVSRKGGQGGMSVLSERKSRLLVVRKLHSMSPAENLRKIRNMMRSLGMKSITFDNGIENKRHASIGVPTFFCDPYSSWQKGGVENGNKMLRRYFPKGTDFALVSQKEIDRAVKIINEKPRKILGYRTAFEVAVANGVLLEESHLCFDRVS
ncbi:MAG: IS30 family transposase [Candidatus Moranbacteria bacterium]|nr:IS30 family transposase [Candidatus Moranbacteria bacterium]